MSRLEAKKAQAAMVEAAANGVRAHASERGGCVSVETAGARLPSASGAWARSTASPLLTRPLGRGRNWPAFAGRRFFRV